MSLKFRPLSLLATKKIHWCLVYTHIEKGHKLSHKYVYGPQKIFSVVFQCSTLTFKSTPTFVSIT